MNSPLRVLIVEDSEFDAQMMAGLIRKSGYDVTNQRVETAEAMRAALQTSRWDVILADYNLPVFSAPEALKILQDSALDIPFIIVSGGIGEATAVAAMKAGAHDYLMKGNLNRLAPAVDRELREAAVRRERREARKALAESEQRYRLLYETADDAILLMDTAGRVLFANPALTEIFGYTSEEVSGQDFTVLLPEALRAHFRKLLQGFIESGVKATVSGATESVGRRKDHAEFPVELSFNEMELEGERRFVCFIRDITERKRAERELFEHQEQLRVARAIQQRLFPKTPPSLPGFDIAGVTFPAEEAGGDFFDYLCMPKNRVGLVLADVTGHGVGPALLMAETRAYLRTLTNNRDEVGEILTRANRLLAEDVGEEHYVTMFLGRLDPATSSFVYASAGHPTGYVLDTSGAIKLALKRTGIPLGLRPGTEYVSQAAVELAHGDMLLLVTDGIEEAMAPDDSFFGIERALQLVHAHRDRPAKEILESLYGSVRAFSQKTPQLDDVTAILVRVL